jgi:hypothetical protein
LGGLLLTRSAVLRRFGGVRGQLLGVGLVGNLLLLGMVVAGAVSMFISLGSTSMCPVKCVNRLVRFRPLLL